jgi:hypothetical protein
MINMTLTILGPIIMEKFSLESIQMTDLVHQFLVSHVSQGNYAGAVVALYKKGRYE